MTKAFLLRSVPPRDTYTLLETKPPMLHTTMSLANPTDPSLQTNLPKKVQQIIITVAREPRFEGERNPSRAKTGNGWSQLGVRVV